MYPGGATYRRRPPNGCYGDIIGFRHKIAAIKNNQICEKRILTKRVISVIIRYAAENSVYVYTVAAGRGRQGFRTLPAHVGGRAFLGVSEQSR